MELNLNEEEFINSIRNKINKFKIKTTLKKCFEIADNIFLETKYNDGSKEIVERNIEFYLCSLSPKYFINQYAMIKHPKRGFLPFKTFPCQNYTVDAFQDHSFVILNKSRQLGFTTIAAGYVTWLINFHEAKAVDVVSIDLRRSMAFKKRVDLVYDNIPQFMKTGTLERNKTNLNLVNGSTLLAEAAGPNAGRADSLSLLVLDECAFIENVRTIWAAALPAVTSTGGKVVLISTTNGIAGIGEFYYQKWIDAVNNDNPDEDLEPMFPIEIDWWEGNPDERDCKWLKKYFHRDYRNKPELYAKLKEIAKDYNKDNNLYLKQQYRDLGEVLYRQEVLREFIMSGEAVVSPEKIEELTAKSKDPIQKDGYKIDYVKGLWVWEYAEKHNKYIIAVDTASGTGKDYSTMQVLNTKTLNQAAEYRAKITTARFPDVIKKVARYYNNAFVVIEGNGLGQSTFDGTYYSKTDPYGNLYKISMTRNGVTRFAAWSTSTKTRPLVIDDAMSHITTPELWEKIQINSLRLVQEFSTLVFNGHKIEAASGANDDLFFAYAIALYNRAKAISMETFIMREDGTMISSDLSGSGEIQDINVDPVGDDKQRNFEKNIGMPIDIYESMFPDHFSKDGEEGKDN